MERPDAWSSVSLLPLSPVVDPVGGVEDHAFRVDADSVCPACFRWVKPHEIVRRTAYGPVQHECCPVPAPTPGS